jgi:hypothetical protein
MRRPQHTAFTSLTSSSECQQRNSLHATTRTPDEGVRGISVKWERLKNRICVHVKWQSSVAGCCYTTLCKVKETTSTARVRGFEPVSSHMGARIARSAKRRTTDWTAWVRSPAGEKYFFSMLQLPYCQFLKASWSRVLWGCSVPPASLPRSPHLCQNGGIYIRGNTEIFQGAWTDLTTCFHPYVIFPIPHFICLAVQYFR